MLILKVGSSNVHVVHENFFFCKFHIFKSQSHLQQPNDRKPNRFKTQHLFKANSTRQKFYTHPAIKFNPDSSFFHFHSLKSHFQVIITLARLLIHIEFWFFWFLFFFSKRKPIKTNEKRNMHFKIRTDFSPDIDFLRMLFGLVSGEFATSSDLDNSAVLFASILAEGWVRIKLYWPDVKRTTEKSGILFDLYSFSIDA